MNCHFLVDDSDHKIIKSESPSFSSSEKTDDFFRLEDDFSFTLPEIAVDEEGREIFESLSAEVFFLNRL
jgi:hypothetical protein